MHLSLEKGRQQKDKKEKESRTQGEEPNLCLLCLDREAFSRPHHLNAIRNCPTAAVNQHSWLTDCIPFSTQTKMKGTTSAWTHALYSDCP